MTDERRSATLQRPDTNCMVAFKKWWADNRVQCEAKGIREEYAWMIYRAGWWAVSA